MSVWFKWEGLQDLIDQFASLASDLTTASTADVEAAANAAKNTIYAGYPTRTGDLKNHLTVRLDPTDTRVRATVINTSDHAVLFERGTQTRQTKLGANRGSMPANPIFSATMIRARRSLFSGPITRVLTVFGLKVSGRA